MQVDDIKDVDGAADWLGGAGAEDGGLAFHVGGWDGGREGGEAEGSRDDGGCEMHGGWLGNVEGVRKWLVIVGLGVENWLRWWCWSCREKSGVALAFIDICSVEFCIGLAVTSIARDLMTVIGIFTAL